MAQPDLKEFYRKCMAEMDKYCLNYKKLLDTSKTEREAVSSFIHMAQISGFREYKREENYSPGTGLIFNQRNKAVILAKIGKEGVKKGAFIIAAHIDSPRLDVKPNPVQQAAGTFYLKTHYYGMIRKYQWTAIPLAFHGHVSTRDGKELNLTIGERENEPKFCVSDLLPHLSEALPPKDLEEFITGERLNVMFSSVESFAGTSIDWRLKETYGFGINDFASAEFCFVPAWRACDVGIDRAYIGGYAQDDKVCAFAAASALMKIDKPEKTCILILADKEETGNGSISGMDSQYFDGFMEDLAERDGVKLRHVFADSSALSADVSSAFDPAFAEAYDPLNVGYLGKGALLQKYNGFKGKSDTSDASAEYLGKLIRLMDENNICWQTGELGRTDLGGGRTLSRCLAHRNIEAADLGVPVISMHSPFEVTSKFDMFMLYLAYKAFMEQKT